MSCKYSKHLFEIFFSAGLVPTITRPTRITHETATLIDNLYVSGKSIVNLHSGILVADISDHFPVLVFIGNSSKKQKRPLFLYTENFIRRLLTELILYYYQQVGLFYHHCKLMNNSMLSIINCRNILTYVPQ